MALLSPTVIRISAIVLVLGTFAFIIAGFLGKADDQSAGSVLLLGVVVGGPISGVVGVITGFLWEKLFGPIKSVEHLDMRKRQYHERQERLRRERQGDIPDVRNADRAGEREAPSKRRYSGRGGGKRRRR